MRANPVAKHYGSLTPRERFRLIVAAGARGDQAERDRLANAAGYIGLSARDFTPYSAAFDELALLVFVELLEGAAGYLEALDAAEARAAFEDAGVEADGDRAARDQAGHGEAGAGAEPAMEAGAVPGESDRDKPSTAERHFRLGLAAGFVFRTKAAGWRLFCERLTIPPFGRWEFLPGFDRLRRALALTEEAAFAPKGFLRWLNAVRPAGRPRVKELHLTPERCAEQLDTLFSERVTSWGG
jgi:hypothetical protein